MQYFGIIRKRRNYRMSKWCQTQQTSPPRPTAGCCHLANFTAWCHSIARLLWPFYGDMCSCFLVIANNKKLSCRRETAQRFVSLNTLLSHSRSLNVIRNDTVKWVGRVLVSICISLKLCLYVVQFLRYSASQNSVTFESGGRVVQGQWKWRRSIDHTTVYWSAFISIAVCYTIFKLFDIESSWPWKDHWRSFKLVPFESLGAVSYSPSIITMAVSLTVYEIFNVKL